MASMDPIHPETLRGYLDGYLTGRYGEENLLKTAADFDAHEDTHQDFHGDQHFDRGDAPIEPLQF